MDQSEEMGTPSRRNKNVLWRLALLAAWVLSWWLLFDSFLFRLMEEDPVTGRERGCYTKVEEWLGVKEPTPIRTIEQLLGGGLFLGVPVVLLGWRYYRKPFSK